MDNSKETQTEPGIAVVRPMKSLISRCEMSALSFDISDGDPRLVIRANLVHASHEDAVQSERDLIELCNFAKAELPALLQKAIESVQEKAREEF